MPSPLPKLTLSTRLLYVVATLPFILLAILYLSGAFDRQLKPGAPTPKPTNSATPTPVATSGSNSASIPNAERIDTARQHPPGLNAADCYKNAYGLYQQLGLTEEEEKMLRDRSGKWDPEKAKALFEKIQPVVEMMRQAKDAAYTDWGITLKTIADRMPQIDPVVKLASLMAWNSAYEFPTDPLQAVADLKVEVQMGQSIGTQGIIGLLVNSSTTTMAFEIMRMNAIALSPEAFSAALDIVQKSNLWDNFPAAMDVEANMGTGFADKLSTSAGLPSKKQTSNPDKMAAEEALNYAVEVEHAFVQKALLPDQQFNAWWQTIQPSPHHPLATVALVNLPGLRQRLFEKAVQRAMVQAGLSVLQNGGSALAKYPDPTTGSPFQLVPNADGFELRSTYQSKGKPIVMPFPTPKP